MHHVHGAECTNAYEGRNVWIYFDSTFLTPFFRIEHKKSL